MILDVAAGVLIAAAICALFGLGARAAAPRKDFELRLGGWIVMTFAVGAGVLIVVLAWS